MFSMNKYYDIFVHYAAIIVVINITNLQGYNGQGACVTTSGTPGRCINIVQCNSLFTVLRNSDKLPPSETGNLKKSFCGIEGSTPKVCCPSTNIQQAAPTTTVGSAGSIPNPPNVASHRNLGLINSGICGPATEGKIINGNKTGVLEFPWMALIKFDIDSAVNGRYQDFQCGGTVINKRWVLTAAHCVTGLKSGTKLYGVRLGEHDLNKEEDCDEVNGVKVVCADKYQDFLVQSFHFHPGYRPDGQNNDIALIKLDRDADFGAKNVKPICLPVGDTAKLSFKKALVTGWGKTETGWASQDLLKVRLQIADNSDCDQIWQRSNNIEVTYKQLCAGGISRMDSCSGDSGGPLQTTDTINGVPKFVQYGIVSFGTRECGYLGYPGVYTRVSYYMNWILDTID